MDLNNDGKLDLVAGDSEGNIWFFKNIGTPTAPKLAAGVKLEADGKPITGTSPKFEKDEQGNYRLVENPNASPSGIYSKIHVADYDDDGLLDLLVGQESPKTGQSEIVFYRNIGTAAAPKFAAPTILALPNAPMMRPSPFLVDWDGDGKKDLLLGSEDKTVYFLRNTGTNKKPTYAPAEKIPLPGLTECYRCRITVVDWNNDGKLDLLLGNFFSGRTDKERGGNVWLFLRK